MARTNKCDGCGKDFTEALQWLDVWDAHPLDPCGRCEDCCTHTHGPVYVRAISSIDLRPVCHGCRMIGDGDVEPADEHLYEGACAGGCGAYHWGLIGWVEPLDKELDESLQELQRHFARAGKLPVDLGVEPLSRDELLAKIRKPTRDRKGV